MVIESKTTNEALLTDIVESHGMRQMLLADTEKLAFVTDAAIPRIGIDEVLIRVGACSVCNRSDLIYYTYLNIFEHCSARGFGHEVAGTIEAVGPGVTDWAPGDRVFARSLLSSGYAEFAAAKASRLGRLPNHVDFDVGASLQLAPLVANATRKIGLGDRVFVAGQGPVGLFVTQFARLRGASEIIVSDLDPWRLEVARQLGATETRVATVGGDPVAQIGDAIDVFVDAVGRPSTVALGVAAIRPGGTIMLLGTHHVEHVIPVDMIALERKAADLISSRERTIDEERNALRTVERLVAADRLMLRPLLTHRFALPQLQEAIDMLSRSSLLAPETPVSNAPMPPPNTLKIAICP
jgi:L-iditol 2-dehydrogenase